MALTIQEVIARRTEVAADELITAALRVSAEKVAWNPMGDARTALDIVQECGRVNDRWADMIASGEWIAWDAAKIEEIKASTPDMPSAVAYLRESTVKYVSAVRGVPDERLDQEFKSPWRTATVAEWLAHALWHMSYHEGQINYIQTLYDDWSYG